MFKRFGIFVVAAIATILWAFPVSAISLSSLEQISAPSENIEINEPESGYNFDANFLAKDQELIYSATITNDEDTEIKITNVSLNSSSYDFLEYSYDGISVDDVLEPGESKTITIAVRTNTNETSTVSEDYDLVINYANISPEPDDPDDPVTPDEPDTPEEQKDDNPNTATATILKTTAIAAISIGAVFFIFARSKKIRHFAIIFTISSLGLYALCPNAQAEDAKEFHILGKVRFTNIYTVTVDPDGGIYNNSEQPTISKVRDGETYHVGEATRDTYSFVKWQANPGELDSNNDIVITADTLILAIWDENHFTLTVNPNGGSYAGSSEVQQFQYREGYAAPISEPNYDKHIFDGWTVEPNTTIGDTIVMDKDYTITANWTPIYTLTIDPNTGIYGNHSEEFSEDYPAGEIVNLDTPTKENYHFTGWTLDDGSAYDSSSVTMNRDIKLIANYDINKFNVTIDPNGGKYNNSTDIYSDTVDYGTVITLRDRTERENYVLSGWTKNGTEHSLDRDTETITITEDTALVAEWNNTYVVTVDPNGGSYHDSQEPSEFRVEAGTTFTLDTPTHATHSHAGWTVDDSYLLDGNSMTITKDTSFRAEWFFPVARIERTGKLYPSIMAAHEEANPGNITDDIITLLVDTEEIVTNSKQVTLDLNTHTVYGYLINTPAGNIRLINGEINNYDNTITDDNNPDGAAVINNGTLTMGYDDYEDDAAHQSAAHIVRDYIRLIGSSVGLQQNATFDFFDGYIEGDAGLVGGYRNSPWYRNSSDQAADYEIHYWPAVSQNAVKNCQHVELDGSDRAVSKTITNGEIYYYNLQDNINMSAITGYDIYIVRNLVHTPTSDSSLAYEITVPENVTTNIDTAGWDVDFNNTMTINGTLNLTNNKAATHISDVKFAQTIQDNGNFNVSDANLEATTNNTLLNLNGNLGLTNANLTSDTATIIEVRGEDSSITSDNVSRIATTQASKNALHNLANSLTINGGNFDATGTTILNDAGKTLNIENANIHSSCVGTTSSYSYSAIENNGALNITNADVKVESTSKYTAYGIKNTGDLVMAGGNIDVKNTGTATGTYYGVYTNDPNSSATITGGKISVTNNAHNTYGIYGKQITITGTEDNAPTIEVTGKAAYGIYAEYGVNVNGGKISANSSTQDTYAIYASNGKADTSFDITDGEFNATSTAGNAYGIYTGTSSPARTFNVSGGTFIAKTEASNKVAYGIASGNTSYNTFNITGGNIYGDTYGVYHVKANIDNPVTLGNAEEPLYNGINKDSDDNILPAKPIISGGVCGVNAGYINFYDGIVRGNDNHFCDMSQVKSTPIGTTYDYGTSDDYEHAIWLIYAENYLHVEGGDDYNSLMEAYANTPDGGTITVIKDFATDELLPTFEKNITFNLNDHSLTYSQPIINNAILTITGGENGNGTLKNANSSVPTIRNTSVKNAANAIVNVKSGTIIGSCGAIISERTNTTNAYPVPQLNITGGTIKTESTESVCNVIESQRSNINISNALITGQTEEANHTIKGIFAYLGGTIIMDSGVVDIAAPIAYGFASQYSTSMTVNINDGTIKATSTPNATGYTATAAAYAMYSVLTVGKTDGSTKPTFTAQYGYDATGITNNSSLTEINNATITASDSTNSSKGISGTAQKKIHNGTITAISNKTAQGVTSGSITFEDGTITATSLSGDAIGIGTKDDTTYTTLTSMSGGTVTATLAEGNTTGVAHGVDVVKSLITGGSVHGDTHGINSKNGSSSSNTTLGVNDSDYHNGVSDNNPQPYISGGIYAINGGYINFYDGKLHGGTNYVSSADNIKAIPTSASYDFANETAEGHQDCWLIEAVNYLRIMRKNASDEYEEISRHNSLSDAFSSAQNGDIIEVIADYATEATHEANTKNVTLDLHGHSLIYKNPIINSGNSTLTITDLSPSKNGSVTSTNEAKTKPTVQNNSGSTLIVDGGLISSIYIAVANYGTMTVNNGTISSTEGIREAACAIQNNGTLNVFNGEIKAIDENSTEYGYSAIKNSGTSNIYGGTITAQGKSGTSAIGYSYGSRANIYSGNLSATSSNDRATTVNAGHVLVAKSPDYPDLPEATITATGKRATGVEGSNDSNIDAGNITVTATETTGSNSAIGVSGLKTMSGGTITVNSYTEAKGVSGYQNYEITGGTINVTSTSANAYGIYTDNTYTDHYTEKISGATVNATATADGKLGEAIYIPSHRSAIITSGTYIGSAYGLYVASPDTNRTVTIGTKDGHFNNGYDEELLLTIRGEVYGAYGGHIYFYDGQLQGGKSAYYDRNIKGIEDNATINQVTKTIDGSDYNTKYVTPEHNIAKIGNGACGDAGTQCFGSLQKAINAAQNNDTIILLEDNYVFEPISIESNKDFTIELDDHTIVTGNQITNSGKLKIQNSSSNKPIIGYHEANCFITNNQGSSFTLQNVEINASCAIDSKNDTTTSIENSTVSFYDNGNLTSIKSTGDLTISNSNISSAYTVISHSTGELKIQNNSTLTSTGVDNNSYPVVETNNSITTISNSQLIHNNIIDGTGSNIPYSYIQKGANSQATISDSTLSGVFRIEAGTVNANDSLISHLGKERQGVVILQDATATFSNTTVELEPYYYNNGSSIYGSFTNDGTVSLTNQSKLIINNQTKSRFIALVNKGNFNLDNSEFSYAYNSDATGNYTTLDYGIYSRAGNINITNNSSVNFDFSNLYPSNNSTTAYGLYVEGGTVNVLDSNLDFTTTTGKTLYGAYIKNASDDVTADVNIDRGHIYATGANTSYGVYIDGSKGSFTMGVKETDTSKYGTDFAIKDSPIVKATGATTGIGIKHPTGIFNYYDGEIIGSSAAKPEGATDAEYEYETKEALGTDGNYHCVLDWIHN